jgi:hypothetical protein
LHTDEVMVEVGWGGVEFVVFVSLGEFKFSQYAHLGHHVQGAVDGGEADGFTVFFQGEMQVFGAEVVALGDGLEHVEDFLALGGEAEATLMEGGFEGGWVVERHWGDDFGFWILDFGFWIGRNGGRSRRVLKSLLKIIFNKFLTWFRIYLQVILNNFSLLQTNIKKGCSPKRPAFFDI